MKKIIKFVALAICILMLLSAFASCKKDQTDEDNSSGSSDVIDSTESQSNTSAIDQSGIEIQDMDGRALTIWYSTLGGWAPYPLSVTEDEVSMDIINDAGYRRNVALERDFNIRLNYRPNDSDPNAGAVRDTSELRNLWSGDIAEYDIILTGGRPAATLSVEGFYVDLADYDVVKTDMPYYENQINEQSRFLGRQFFASGFYTAKLPESLEVTFVNTKILFSYEKDMTVEGLNTLALEHKWTIERLLNLGKEYATPETNTGAYATDMYSLVLSYNNAHSLFYDLGGYGITYNDNTGKYSCTISTQKEQNLLTWIQDNLAKESGKTVGYIKNDEHTQAFIANSAPFMLGTLGSIPMMLDAEMEWTILPPPTLEEGDAYNSFAPAWNLNFAGVPSGALDTETSAYLFEAFMCYSYDYIYPASYERTFGTQYMPDNSSVQVYDLVTKSRCVSLINLYALNTTSTAIKEVCRDSNIGVSSFCTNVASNIANNITKLVSSFNSLKK